MFGENPVIHFERVKKSIFLAVAAAVFIGNPLHCASKKSKEKKSSDKNIEIDDEGSVKLSSVKRTFFYKIDPQILSGVEKGSPESLKTAMQAIHKPNAEYEENEKVLIAIAAKMMQIVWPSQKITWDIPDISKENVYLGAIASAENGIFDTSTGKSDFLSVLIPAFVVLSPSAAAADYPLSEEACISALKLNPDSVIANYLLGIVYKKQDKNELAEAALKKAFEGSGMVKETAIAYGQVLLNAGCIDEVAKIADSFPADSNDIDILRLKAYSAFARRDFAGAEQFVARVLQQTPNNLEFVLFRAKILVEKNDYIRAVSLLDVYARQNDTSIDYLILRAKVQLEWNKNIASATQTVEKALQLYPENTDALMFAAKISAESDSPVAGKYADELAAKILEKNPESREAMSYALSGLVQRENWRAAYDIAVKLIAYPDVSAAVIGSYVEVCLKLNKKSEAFEYAKKMQLQYPDDETVLQSYILAYSQTGSRDVVMKYIDSIMNTSSAKMKSYLYYRRSFLQLSEDNALADLRSSLISNPRNSEALFRLYEVYYSKDDYRKAQYYLRQVVSIKPNDSSIRKLNEALTQLIK